MSNLPTLIVDGDPEDWLPALYQPDLGDVPLRDTVRVDGPLPTVAAMYGSLPGFPGVNTRPLRAGDRAVLASRQAAPRHAISPGHYDVPFATATVAKMQPVSRIVARKKVTDRWLVTVTDVEALS